MPQRQSFNAYWQWHAVMFVLKIASEFVTPVMPPAAVSTWIARFPFHSNFSLYLSFSFFYFSLADAVFSTYVYRYSLSLFYCFRVIFLSIFRFCAIFHFMILLRNFFFWLCILFFSFSVCRECTLTLLVHSL